MLSETSPTAADAALAGLGIEGEVESGPRPERRDHVAAVLVCADGARWLPAVLTSLARSERTPHVVVAVDCSSTDATGRLLATALEQGVVDEVVTVPVGTGFGAAVAAGAARAAPGSGAWTTRQQWLWLLHDDAAPAPYALEELLHASDDAPSVGIVGPKVRGWHDHRLLLECGVTISRGGARVTGLERREFDQGQRDGLRDVLAVGSAGMLVRRDVWEQLEGFDPALAFFRDDVDFCWRARRAGVRVVVTGAAVVHHRQAGTNGARLLGGRSPRRADRAAALHVLLAHASRVALPVALARLVLGSLLRALGFLLAKAPTEARDELGALLDTVRRPGALCRSRALARRAGAAPEAVPERDVRALLAPRGSQLRAAWERVVGTVLSGRAVASDLDDFADGDGWTLPTTESRWRSWLVRPGVLLALALLVTTAVAVRSLVGAGQLTGGALLAAPPGATDLLDAYRSAWHDVGLGSAAVAPVWLALVALPATLLWGQAPLAVDVLLLLAVPMAGLAAYWASNGLVASRWLRAWAAATYALLPAVTVGVGSGRLGVCVVAVLLPVLARSAARLLGAGRPTTWRRAWGTGLLLTVVTAFVPLLWVVAAVLGVGVALVVRRSVLRVAVLLLTPLLLLGPWTLRLLADPGLLLLEAGLSGPTDRHLDVVDLLLLHPGGPGSTPLWFTAPLLVVALVAVLRRSRWRTVLPAWVAALVALALAVVQVAVLVDVEGAARPLRPWAGPLTLVAGVALLTAALAGADGARVAMARWSFGWRQPAVALLAVVVLLVPFAATAVWVLGVRGPVERVSPELVPAFVAAELAAPTRVRVLEVRVRSGHVQYGLLNSAGPVLGDRDVAEQPPQQVDRAVGALLAGVGGDEVDTLAAWSVRYVQLRGPAAQDRSLVRALDGQAGLRRVSAGKRTTLWRVAAAAPRAQLLPGTGAPMPLTAGRGTPLLVTATLPPATAPGRLVLAQADAPGWVVRAGGPDGQPLPSDVTGPPVAGRFVADVPAGTRELFLTYEDPGRSRALVVQLVLVLVVVVLALPARRRVEEDVDADLPDVAVTGTAAVPDPAAVAAATPGQAP